MGACQSLTPEINKTVQQVGLFFLMVTGHLQLLSWKQRVVPTSRVFFSDGADIQITRECAIGLLFQVLMIFSYHTKFTGDGGLGIFL